MGRVFEIDFGRGRERKGQPVSRGEQAGMEDDAVIEANIEAAQARLADIVGDAKTANPKAEGQLLLLNNLLDLKPIIDYLQSLRGPVSSSNVRATAGQNWGRLDDLELVQAVQAALRSGQAEWQSHPGRYLELVRSYQKRVREIIESK